MPDHFGFTYWDVLDVNHPFPLGDIDPRWNADEGAQAIVEFTLPQALPAPKSVAVRSIGFPHQAQLWFALECTTQKNGAISYKAVLHARHLHFFTDHGESEAGEELQLLIPDAALRGGGVDEVFGVHGEHCDLCDVIWFQDQGKVNVSLRVIHLNNSERAYRAIREELAREAKEHPILVDPGVEVPLPPEPEPAPPVIDPDGN